MKGEGSRPVVAIALSEPAFTCWSTEGIVSNITLTWPPIMSVIAGPEPR